MARSGPLLTEAQWKKIAPLLPKPPKQRKGGRPWIENRRVLEGILWILRSGARWQDLPEKFPHPSTCWRRLRDWEERGVWLNIWRAFLSELNERQQLKWSESFLDGSFAPAKKGAAESEKPSGARGRSGWWWSTAAVFLWETTFTLPPRRKSRLAETTLATIRVGRSHHAGRPRQKPVRVIADKAYDSDPLRKRLRRRGIELICPHKKQSRSARDAGWPSLAALPAAMDRGTHQRLAGKLPALGCALRPFAHNLWRVLSYRLLHDRLTEGCAIASS